MSKDLFSENYYKYLGKCGQYLPNFYRIKKGNQEFYIRENQLPIFFSIAEIRMFKLKKINDEILLQNTCE